MPTPQRLSDEDFGQKIYERFPTQYQIDDVGEKLSLKRYIQALSDGGFKYVIQDANGILDIVNPTATDISVVYKLYEQYGLKVFHGIPEDYLRTFLPFIGTAWQKKGSLDVTEYISSMLSGIKTETSVSYQDDSNATFGEAVFGKAIFGNTDTCSYPIVTVKLEMDYALSDYFPDATQFRRLLENFIPFYALLNLVYSYLYTEEQALAKREEFIDNVVHTVLESKELSAKEYSAQTMKYTLEDKQGITSYCGSSYFNDTKAVFGEFTLGYIPEIDNFSIAVQKEEQKLNQAETLKDIFVETKEEVSSILQYGVIDSENSVFGISQPFGIAVFGDDKFKAPNEVVVDNLGVSYADKASIHQLGSARFTESVFGDFYLGFVPSEVKVNTTLIDSASAKGAESGIDKVSTMSVKNATFKHAILGFAFLGNNSFDTETVTY